MPTMWGLPFQRRSAALSRENPTALWLRHHQNPHLLWCKIVPECTQTGRVWNFGAEFVLWVRFTVSAIIMFWNAWFHLYFCPNGLLSSCAVTKQILHPLSPEWWPLILKREKVCVTLHVSDHTAVSPKGFQQPEKRDYTASSISSLSLIQGKDCYRKQRPTQHCGMEALALLARAVLSNIPSRAFSIAFAGSLAASHPERVRSLCPRGHSGTDGKSAVTVHSTGTLNKQKIMAGSSHLRMGDSACLALFSECWEKSVLIAQTSEQLL